RCPPRRSSADAAAHTAREHSDTPPAHAEPEVPSTPPAARTHACPQHLPPSAHHTSPTAPPAVGERLGVTNSVLRLVAAMQGHDPAGEVAVGHRAPAGFVHQAGEPVLVGPARDRLR